MCLTTNKHLKTMIKTNSSSTNATASSSPPPPPPPPLAVTADHVMSFAAQQQPKPKTLTSAANLANLLPTGTVLAFQTLAPSFSNKGNCRISNKCLTASLVAFCAAVCFLSSFTDSFTDAGGKLYYGIATRKGLLVFNRPPESRVVDDLSRFRVRFIDLVHAWVSLLVFLAFALSDVNVEGCFFPSGGADLDVVVMNLPLAAGLFATFFFTLFPTTRRGIGYSDSPPPATSLPNPTL